MKRKRTPEMRMVGGEVKRIRRERGVTQGEMAEVLDTDPTSVSHIEAGRQELRVTQLAKVAKKLQVRVTDLVAPLDARFVTTTR